MVSPHFNSPEHDFIKDLLEPLLDDFQYWFSRSRSLLESQDIAFLEQAQQADLLQRVVQAQQEVETAKMMLNITGGQVGLDTAVLMPWHHLVTECWQVGMRFRTEQSHFGNSGSDSSRNLRD
jgi:nitrogen-specific signal transduction histidine kinase